MQSINLLAHFDGKQIVLDQPYNLPINVPLIVTVIGAAPATESEEEWLKAVAESDAFAFLSDPAEDIYSAADGEAIQDAE